MRRIEQALSGFYESDNYQQMGAQTVERIGTVGILETNERFIKDNMQLLPKPDGYIIGIGNGAIWYMLNLFQEGTLPKGVISLDRDSCVVLSGKILIELAKQGVTRDEAVAFFYEGEIDDILDVARNIVQNEKNYRFKQELDATLNTGQLASDLELLRRLQRNPADSDIRRRKNITAVISHHWPSITLLAREDKITFLHSDVANETTLKFITAQLPDIIDLRNILYTSNVVDKRYRHELLSWKIFNTSGKGWYIFTSARDDYILQSSHNPPIYHE